MHDVVVTYIYFVSPECLQPKIIAELHATEADLRNGGLDCGLSVFQPDERCTLRFLSPAPIASGDEEYVWAIDQELEDTIRERFAALHEDVVVRSVETDLGEEPIFAV